MGKREEFNEKILELLHQSDIREVTMEDIAHNLGVTKRTLYNHYQDKASMLMEVMEQHVQKKLDYIATIQKMGGRDAIMEIMMLVDNVDRGNKEYTRNFIQSIFTSYPEILSHCDRMSEHAAMDYLLSNMNRGRHEGIYRTDFNPEIISNLMFKILDDFRTDFFNNSQEYDIREAFLQVIFCIFRGIVTPKGSEILEREINRINK